MKAVSAVSLVVPADVAIGVVVRAGRREERRMAQLRRRHRAARATRRSIRSTRPTSTSSRSPGASRPTISGPRPEYQFEGDAADGQRRALLDGRHPPRRRRARCGDRRAALDAQRTRRRARHRGAAAAFGPRPGVLDRRPRRAHPLRDAGLPAHCARREDRRARRRLRQERRRRSEAGQRSGHRPDERRDRASCDADRRQKRRHRRRRAQTGREPQEHAAT